MKIKENVKTFIEELEVIHKQIEELKLKEKQLLLKTCTEYQTKYNKYKNTFVKIVVEQDNILIYMYVTDIIYDGLDICFKGTAIWENNESDNQYNFSLAYDDTVYVNESDIEPITLLDWNKKLEEIKNCFTINIEV